MAAAVSSIYVVRYLSYLRPLQLAPVQKELDDQKAQLSELRDKVSGIIETFETRILGLAAEIEGLRAQAPGHCAGEVQRPKETPHRIPNPPSTPKRVRSPVDPLG